MVKQDLAGGVKFDRIGGDGLYGHSYELCKGLDSINRFFVLDVHCDEKVFQSQPQIAVPIKKSAKGHPPKHLKADIRDIRLDKIYKNLLQIFFCNI